MRSMKTVVLTLSSRFPGYHARRGQPTRFAENVVSGRKVHTIRSGYDRWKHNLDKVIRGDFSLSVREWSGRPYNSPQVERTSYCGPVVGYQRIQMNYEPQQDKLEILIDGRPFGGDVGIIAGNDGLSVEDFMRWMFPGTRYSNCQTFDGIIIHFTPLRYC